MLNIFRRKKPVLTAEQCNAVLARLRDKDLPAAEKRLADAQAAHEAGYLEALAKGDDVGARRLEKRIAGAEAECAKIRRDITAAEAEHERISAESAARAEEASRREQHKHILSYGDGLERIDQYCRALATELVNEQRIRERIREVSGWSALFTPGNVPPVFQKDALNNLILERLWAESDGLIGKPCSLATMDDIKKGPSLKERFARELPTIERELGITPPEPPSAA